MLCLDVKIATIFRLKKQLVTVLVRMSVSRKYSFQMVVFAWIDLSFTRNRLSIDIWTQMRNWPGGTK